MDQTEPSQLGHQMPVADPQLPSSPATDSAIVALHTKQEDNPTSLYMAQLPPESLSWSQQPAADVSDPSAMLGTADFQWASAADAEALFPGSSGSSTYGLSQQSYDAYEKNGMLVSLYCDPNQAFDITNIEGFEGWNSSSYNAIQPRSIPETQFHNIAGQPYQQVNPGACLNYEVRQSVEQDPFQAYERETLQRQRLYMSALPHYALTARPSLTPLPSEHSGSHETAYDYEEAEQDNEQPYAQLIWRALLSAPDHCMQLSEIYEWIMENTDKVKEKSGNGWRNSIRHNLSMNKAFEKTSPETKSKKGGKNTWRLLQEFVEKGPESTTRYRRKEPGFKRPRSKLHPAKPQRQQAGSKGGMAARRAADQRRSQRLRDMYMQQNQVLRSQSFRTSSHGSVSPAYVRFDGMPHCPPSPAISADHHHEYRSHPPSPCFDLEDVNQQNSWSHHPTPQSQKPCIHPSQAQPPLSLNTHGGPGSDPLRGLMSRQIPPHAQSNIHRPDQVDQIILSDLEGRGLFASDGDSPETASEASQPRTPSTVNSANDTFGGVPPSIGVDPSPFDYLS